MSCVCTQTLNLNKHTFTSFQLLLTNYFKLLCCTPCFSLFSSLFSSLPLSPLSWQFSTGTFFKKILPVLIFFSPISALFHSRWPCVEEACCYHIMPLVFLPLRSCCLWLRQSFSIVAISSLCCWMIFFRAPSRSCCCFCRNSCSCASQREDQ